MTYRKLSFGIMFVLSVMQTAAMKRTGSPLVKSEQPKELKTIESFDASDVSEKPRIWDTVLQGRPLYDALKENDPLGFWMCLEAGTNPNEKDATGVPILHGAYFDAKSVGDDIVVDAKGDNILELPELLLNHGADPNGQTVRGITLLHKLTFTPWVPARHLNYLLERGADVNAPDCESWTPLHHLASGVRLNRTTAEKIKVLLDKRADPNSQTVDGQTPMHFAATDKEIVRFLILAGGDEEVTVDGKTPYDYSRRDGLPNNELQDRSLVRKQIIMPHLLPAMGNDVVGFLSKRQITGKQMSHRTLTDSYYKELMLTFR